MNIFRNLALFVVFALCAQQANAHNHLDDENKSKQKTSDIKQLLKETAADDSKIAIQFETMTISVDFADEQHERALGLMYKREMCEDCGMLFEFEGNQIGSIWMKNTYIPLDLAYITKDGIIVDIKPLTPHDLVAVNSPEPVLYALEMNQGWFDKQNIRVGDKVDLLP